MSMLDILKKLDKIESKKSLNESTLTECPPEMGMAAPSSGPASLNISAGNASEMAQILKALMSIDHGSSGPVIDMNPEAEGAIGGIAGAALGGAMGGIPGAIAGGAIGDKLSSNEKAVDEWDNTPEEKYQDHKYMTKDLSGGINRQKKMYKPAAKGDNPMAVESIKDRLYRALNEKKAKPDFLDMDKDGNKKEPMKKAVADKKKKVPVKESSSIDNQINMLFGKIYDYGDAGLDYLDSRAPLYSKLADRFDGDLDAILANTPDQVKMNLAKEMKSVLDSMTFELESVSEAAKPDFLDMDKDGNKKEPMKKAVADKKKAPFKK